MDDVYAKVQSLFRELTGQTMPPDSDSAGREKIARQDTEMEKPVDKPIIFVLGMWTSQHPCCEDYLARTTTTSENLQ